MSSNRTTGTDKNSVDRTKRGRGGASARAVKDVRHRLNSFQPNFPRFERELLQSFAQSHIKSIYFFPALIIIVGGVSYPWLGLALCLGWIGMMMLVYGVFLSRCRELIALKLSDLDPVYWRSSLSRIMLVVGLGWAVLFVPLNLDDFPLAHQVMQFSVLLCVMALFTMTSYPIKDTMAYALSPAVAILIIHFLVYLDPISLTMAAVLIVAQVFFSVLGRRLYLNARDNLKYQAEKDQLIADLETASSISDEARRRAEEANLAKSRFLATMSHELRTPLNAILGFSEVMVKEILGPLNNEHYREYLGDIHSSGTHLLALINEILDLSRVEAGRYNLHEEAVRLDFIAAECEQMVNLKAKNKDINIDLQAEADLPRVWADERSIRQVILNLLSNALKFTPRGGKVWIKIGWTAGGGQYVSVSDNGPGIAEEEIPIVLSSFGQGSIAIKSAEQGTGLGLPIVQALVEKHEGTFELKSKLRVGTEAIVILPRARIMEVMPPIEQETPAMTTPEPKWAFRDKFFKGRKASTDSNK